MLCLVFSFESQYSLRLQGALMVQLFCIMRRMCIWCSQAVAISVAIWMMLSGEFSCVFVALCILLCKCTFLCCLLPIDCTDLYDLKTLLGLQIVCK